MPLGTPSVGAPAVLLVEILKKLGRRRRDFDERYRQLQDRLQSDEPPDDAEVEAMLNVQSDDPLPLLARGLEELTGIPAADWIELACRLPTAIGAGPYSKVDGSQWRDLRPLLGKLHELDRDGSANRLIGDLAKRAPSLSAAIGITAPHSIAVVDLNSRQPAAQTNVTLDIVADEVGSGDTKKGHQKKSPKKMHPWNGTAQNCFNDFVKERSKGKADDLKSHVFGWVVGKKKNGKPIGPHGLYKRFTENPERWKPFLAKTAGGHSKDT
jgi:hypothetical protein